MFTTVRERNSNGNLTFIPCSGRNPLLSSEAFLPDGLRCHVDTPKCRPARIELTIGFPPPANLKPGSRWRACEKWELVQLPLARSAVLQRAQIESRAQDTSVGSETRTGRATDSHRHCTLATMIVTITPPFHIAVGYPEYYFKAVFLSNLTALSLEDNHG